MREVEVTEGEREGGEEKVSSKRMDCKKCWEGEGE